MSFPLCGHPVLGAPRDTERENICSPVGISRVDQGSF